MSPKEKYVSHPLLAQLPVFFQPWWLDIVSDNWHIALAERDGRLEGVWPYAIDRKLGFKIIRNPLLTPYLGPFFFYPDNLLEDAREQFEEDVFNRLWQQLPSWDSFDLEATTAFGNSPLFTQKGFSCTPKVTYENDLMPAGTQLFKAMHSNHRNLIRQAESRHEIVAGEAYIPGLLQLHKATFQRKNKPYPFDVTTTEALIRESIIRGAGQLFATKDEDNNITANIFTVWDQEKMYLLLSTTDPDTAHPGAVRLLIWHAMKTAQQRGIPVFDFEGSMDPGIAAFFSRFGGSRKTYLCFTKHQSLLWKWKRALLG